MKKTKNSLMHSVIALLVCISMLIGTTFAWFSDKISNGKNIITAGNLDLEMYWTDDLNSGEWHNVEEDGHNTIFSYENWEPGYTDVKYIKLVNAGELALNYKLSLTPQNGVGKLAEVINVYFAEGGVNVEQRSDLNNLKVIGLLNNVLNGGATADGTLLAAEQSSPLHPSGEVIVTMAMNMLTSAGNDYQNEDAGQFTITALATQAPFEKDSFGSDYDAEAKFPTILTGGSASATVTPVEGKVPAGGVTLNGGKVSAFVPEGVVLENGVTELILTVTPLENTTSDIDVVNDEILIPMDVHIEGIADTNNVPIIIDLGEVLPQYLNMGNYRLIHVEDGVNHEMTLVAGKTDFAEHNQFAYDSDTGAVSVAMATFSEVALVADTGNAWQGGTDDTWYDADATELIITNGDQLNSFSKMVGKDNDFAGKTIKLIADINLNGNIFYPIGYYNNQDKYDRNNAVGVEDVVSNVSSFSGIFNGNGHTISNFYQNTWEMFGDYNSGYSGTPNYYKDAMGLFGYVNGGTIENLTVDHFESDGEFTPTGVITAYAVDSNFKNIAITNCNPRVYNTGNGGIVGVGGNESDGAGKTLTFTNITVDNTNTISALWGSWDVACGGIMGMFRGKGEVNFDNCHVAAKIDVYNDVCGNYQYYWYRYAGMMIGTNYNMTEDADGYTVPDLTMITAKACTVSFDEWNDYYYCELVANSLASYTHDHQFSRLQKVDSVDKENMTYKVGSTETAIPTEGRYNFVTLADGYETENATCYHFVDGQQWRHSDAGTETVNGETVLKEDKQHYYLPFNQLFTGYGWGVKHIPIDGTEGSNLSEVTDANGEKLYPNLDIQILDRDYETKFKVLEEISNKDYLFRVGNGNAFPIGKLFKLAVDESKINKSGVYASVTSLIEGVEMSSTFTLNESDWAQSTLKITGSGPAKITIQDYSMCTPTELIVEVIDAKNITNATGTTSGGDMVLLCDVNASDYVYYWNCTLYGNGFTYSLNGAPTNYSSSHGHGVLITKNATLDNLVIIGDVYDEYGAYTSNNDYNAAIDVLGDTVIQNCYISGCSAPISARANATITNTTLYGGAVANLLIKGGTVTLENVTTANYNDNRNAPIGMGIVVHSDASETAKLVINGTLTQYNFLNEEDTPSDTYAKNLHSTMFGSSLGQYHFGSSPNRRVNTGVVSLTATFDGGDITDNANTGYIGSNVTLSSVNGYVYTQLNTSGSVNNNYDKNADTHVSTTQGPVPPSCSFDHTKNYVAKTDGSNDYCYEENGTVHISMDQGDTFNWDTSILTATKVGNALDYTVSMNGADYTGKNIVFNTAGNYEVKYTYTDGINYALDENGNITTYEKTYTKTVNISVAVIEAAAKNAEFTMGSSGATTEKITIDNVTYISATGVTADNSTWTYITINGQKIYYPIVAAKLTSTKGSSTYAYFPVFENVVTITDYTDNGTGDAFTYDSSTTVASHTALPTAVKGIYKAASDVTYWYNLNNSHLTQSGASKIFKWASSSDAPSDPTTYSNVLCYKSPQVSADRVAYITLVQYSYTDSTNTTYYYYVGYTLEAFTKQTTCVTPNTLVTLTDGTQKEIQYVTYEDELVVWDFVNGEYTTATSSIIMNHGYDHYKVVTLNFADGTVVNTINGHGFFNQDTKEFVILSEANVKDYIGHNFVKQDGKDNTVTQLVSYSVTEEYTESWSILTAEHYNCILEGMLTLTPAEVEDSPKYLMPFVIDGNMKYDADSMQADIEKYGLYTYEEFANSLTYEQYNALNLQYFKVSVGKGLITYDEILYLIDLHM